MFANMSLEAPEHSLSPQELRDPRAMRALAHPLRLKLLELVTREGTLTSTQASRLTGENTGSCSFHLRQLAKYGFVEDVPGQGRERPWRAARLDTRWTFAGPEGDSTAAAEELNAQLLARDLTALDAYLRTREDEPEGWREAGLMSTSLLYLTPEEFEEFGAEFMELVRRRLPRTAEPAQRPEGSRPVRLVSIAVPLPD
jgi:hypothetical protein